MLLNICLLVFIWVKKPNRNPPTFLEENLGFSEQQKNGFEVLRNEHREQTNAIKTDINSLKDELYSNFGDEGIDEEKAKGIAQKIGTKKAEADLITFRHFKAIRKICTPEQQKKLDEIINELVRRMTEQPMPPNERNGKERPPHGKRPPNGDGPPDGMPPPPPR